MSRQKKRHGRGAVKQSGLELELQRTLQGLQEKPADLPPSPPPIARRNPSTQKPPFRSVSPKGKF